MLFYQKFKLANYLCIKFSGSMKKLFYLLINVFCLGLLSSCSTTLQTEKPSEKYLKYSFTPQASVISLPVEMKVTALEALINKQLTGLIYEDNSLEDNGGDNLMVKAWKTENIKLNFDKGQFIYRVPLKLWIKAGWKIEKFGLSLSDYREVNAGIALNFHTSITVNKDWSLTTLTVSDGYEWTSKPVLKVGPVDIPITFIADLIIKSNMETISSAIDEGMKSSLDVKTNALEAWKEIQEPMLLDEEYGLWLRIIPKSISATPITGGKGIIRHTSTIQGVAECFTGKKPPVVLNSKLPDLMPSTKTTDEFLANVTSYISYEYIDSITKQELINTSYTFGKKKITITDCKIYGNEDKMIVSTDVTGSLKGKIYFAGTPFYRQSDSSLILKDLQFNIQTRNVLLKTASWLANSGIEKMIEKKMSYPIGADLMETYTLMQTSLKRYDLGEGFYISGVLNGMEIQQPVLAPNSIIAPVSIKGKIVVLLDENQGK